MAEVFQQGSLYLDKGSKKDFPDRALTSSRKQRVNSPPSWLNEISTTMFSTRHFIIFTCTCVFKQKESYIYHQELLNRVQGIEKSLIEIFWHAF
jgi:hypothetical protein